MVDDEQFNLNLNKKIILILIAIAITGFAGYVLGVFNTNSKLSGNLNLLEQYQNGFNKCNNHCLDNNLTGYIRQMDNTHYKCNCFNITGANNGFIQQ